MTAANYFWVNNEVVAVPRKMIPASFKMSDGELDKYVGCYCVDTYRTDADQRYGRFVHDHSIACGIDWEYVPFEDFPPEFKANLLLLGVS